MDSHSPSTVDRARGPYRAAAAAVLIAAAVAACAPRTDPRLATPESTLRTLLDAYALGDVPQAEVRRRLDAGTRFELVDERSWRRCFDDLRTPQDEGLAGFVLGSLAAHKDALRVELGDDRAVVRPVDAAADRAIVLRRRVNGWRIVLRESVPRDVRLALYGEYERLASRHPLSR